LIKPGTYFLDLEKEEKEGRKCLSIIKVGIRASRSPWILMGYVTNFLARGDSILLTLFLVLWS